MECLIELVYNPYSNGSLVTPLQRSLIICRYLLLRKVYVNISFAILIEIYRYFSGTSIATTGSWFSGFRSMIRYFYSSVRRSIYCIIKHGNVFVDSTITVNVNNSFIIAGHDDEPAPTPTPTSTLTLAILLAYLYPLRSPA